MTADELSRILDELGKRLGPTGRHVFDLAVRQVYIDAIIGIVIGVVVVSIYVVGMNKLIAMTRSALVRQKESDHYYSSDPFLDWFPVDMVGIFAGVAVILGVRNLVDSLSHLANPEYAALRDLMGALVK